MRAVFARNPLVVAVVRLHVVAVLFLDKLAFYTEVGNNILVSSIKNIIIDLVHPNVALLHLLLSHDAVSAGSCSIRLVGRSISLRNTFSDGIRHRLACVNQRQIPVGIPVGIRIFLHVFPIKAPRAQINVIVEFVIAVFIVAADPDHIIVVQKTGVNDPIGMLQCYVCKPATFGHHRTVLAGSGFAQTDLRGSHRFGSRVVLIPKLNCACVVLVEINDAADIPPVAFHAFIIAVATAHLPPAVPFAVPPIEQCVSGRTGGLRFRIGDRFPAERSRVNGDCTFFAAEKFLKGRFDFTGRVF